MDNYLICNVQYIQQIHIIIYIFYQCLAGLVSLMFVKHLRSNHVLVIVNKTEIKEETKIEGSAALMA